MGHRRAEDRAVNLLLEGARVPAGPGTGEEPTRAMRAAVEANRDAAVILAGVADLVHPADPRDDAQAGGTRAAWQDQWLRIWRRYQLPWKLVAFFDELSAMESEVGVCDRVVEHAVRIVGAYTAVVLLPDGETGLLRVAAGWSVGGEPLEMEVVRSPGLAEAGLISALDVRRSRDARLGDLEPLVRNPAVALLAHVPFGAGGVLLLTERRSERIFTADDWEALATLAEHGSAALRRLAVLESARSASLTDPLTALANRRQMEVVLKHAWAAAERGEGLAVLMLDLDGFKLVNDRYGHAAGDDILRVVGQVLQEEARGSDAVVRYGGDEFLVIMPRGTPAGARLLAGRVAKRLAGWVEVSAGVAGHHPSHAGPDDLIAAADADLYFQRDARRPRLLSG